MLTVVIIVIAVIIILLLWWWLTRRPVEPEASYQPPPTPKWSAEQAPVEAPPSVQPLVSEAEREAHIAAPAAEPVGWTEEVEVAPAAEAEKSVEPAMPAPETEQLAEAVAPAAQTEPAPSDDLKVIEGIGPKIAAILQSHGITTFAQLAATDVEQLREIMLAANLRIADPSTWPQQAALAAAGKWDELQTLQDSLRGGRRV